MKLLTKEIENKLEKAPFGSKDGDGLDAKLIVKYFNPYGAGTWLITEGEKQEDGDWMLYGFCHIFEWEWGTVMLSELESVHPFPAYPKLGIERDYYATGTVRDHVPLDAQYDRDSATNP